MLKLSGPQLEREEYKGMSGPIEGDHSDGGQSDRISVTTATL